MKHRVRALLFVSAAVAALGAATPFVLPLVTAPLSAAEEPAAAAKPKPPTITVAPAERREIVETAVVTGSLIPREEVLVGVDLDGLRIVSLEADEGDAVKEGQILARLSTDTIEIQLAQNASTLARSEAAIAQAKSQIAEATATEIEAIAALKRAEALSAKNVVAQDVLDQRRSAAEGASARRAVAEQGLKLAEADRALAEAQRREHELRLAKTEIKAPTGGIVLARAARIGAIASSGAEPMFRLARDGAIELDAEVPETLLARIHAGQSVAVTAPGGTVTGSVRLVSPKVDQATRLGRVRVALPAEAKLHPGSFARGTVEIDRRVGISVPATAVNASDDGLTVQIVTDGRIETRKVETGLSDRSGVEILSGLVEGEKVVVRAGTFVRDGDVVTPVEAKGGKPEAKG